MDNIKNDTYYKNLILNDVEKIILYSKDKSYEEFIEGSIKLILFRHL